MMNRLLDEGKKLKCFSCFDSRREDRNINHNPHRQKTRKKHNSRGDKTSQNCSGILGKKKNNKVASSASPKTGPQNSSSGNVSSASPTSFTFQELANATNNFSSQCLVREEDFGCLYKGTLANGQVVAVKKLDGNARQCNMRLLVEVLILNCLSHPNIVKMIGYCSDGDRRLIIYEYLPLGLLKSHLHDLPPGKEPLDWITRMKIAAGATKALEYLHDKAKPQVIFRDFKPSCVLLDDERLPKLYNFGLAKICSIKNEPHKIVGTQGYCAPESMEPGGLSVKSDLYSFGVVLLELITGRKAIDTTKPPGEQRLVEWVKQFVSDPKSVDKLADPKMEGKFPRRSLYQALTVASVCIREDPASRPPIGNVVTALTYLVNQSNRSDEDSIKKGDADSLIENDGSSKVDG